MIEDIELRTETITYFFSLSSLKDTLTNLTFYTENYELTKYTQERGWRIQGGASDISGANFLRFPTISEKNWPKY